MSRRNGHAALPRTFWRFFLPILCVTAGAFVIVTTVTYFRGQQTFVNAHGTAAASLIASIESDLAHQGFTPDFTRHVEGLARGSDGVLAVFDETCEPLASSVTLDRSRWARDCAWIKETKLRAEPGASPVPGRLEKRLHSADSLFWVADGPVPGQYIVFLLPAAILSDSMSAFVNTILVTGTAAVMALGFALAMLLANLLRPVSCLANAYDRLQAGDFTVRADEHMSGEIGDLCRQFNAMVRSLQELMQTEQLRQVEMDEAYRTLEQQVRTRTAALAAKARELEEANQRLTEMDRLKTAFLSSVSHELRTPLTAVLGFAKLIRRDFIRSFTPPSGDNPRQAELAVRITRNCDIIISEGERLTRLINDVLDLAKIESGRMTWHDEQIALDELINAAAATFKTRAAEQGVALVLDLPSGLPRLVADRDRVTQVLLNLLDNAFKFTAEGEVRITASAGAGLAEIAVHDTGMGIPPEELPLIFDKFHQTTRRDTLRDKPPGTGLGLAICRQILAHYGGSIRAESTPGQGSTMTVTLPIVTA